MPLIAAPDWDAVPQQSLGVAKDNPSPSGFSTCTDRSDENLGIVHGNPFKLR